MNDMYNRMIEYIPNRAYKYSQILWFVMDIAISAFLIVVFENKKWDTILFLFVMVIVLSYLWYNEWRLSGIKIMFEEESIKITNRKHVLYWQKYEDIKYAYFARDTR